jgi:hypothetical protein
VDATAELRSHHSLALRGVEDQPDRFLDVLDARGEFDTLSVVGLDGELPATTEEVFAHLDTSYPITTVGQPVTIEFGGPLSTMESPCLAAGMLLIRTLKLPG